MEKTGWIIVGSILGVGAIATAGYFIWKNRQPSDVEDVFEEETDKTKEKLQADNTNQYLGTLIEKIWIMDNTSKYTPEGAKGRSDFIEKSRNLNRELQHMGLTYWRDDKTHNLEKNGQTVVTLPRA